MRHRLPRLTLLAALQLGLFASAQGQPAMDAFPNLRSVGPINAQSGQVIENVEISNPRGPCITVGEGVTDVVIRNSRIGPCGPAGMKDYGVWILQGARRITVQNNVIHDVGSGVKAARALNPLVIDRNYFYNIRGPLWNGQAIQFNGVTGAEGRSRVICNVSDASAGSGRRSYEDHISMFQSAGSPQAPIEIAYNRVRGGTSKSGGGITVGDKGGAWIHVHDNVVVKVANSGIGVAGGDDILVENNRVDNRGDSAASLTHVAYFVRALSACKNITLRGNRGVARLWNWGETSGETVPGYRHGPQQCSNVEDSGNNFGDASLSPAMFDEIPVPCRR